jgi:hypothetical protein
MNWNDKTKIGAKVYYTSPHGTKENGIVKSLNDSKTAAFVVYQCNGEWDKYFNYTGQHTNINDLEFGWVDDNGKLLKEYCDHHYTPTNSKWQSPTQVSCQFCGDVIG